MWKILLVLLVGLGVALYVPESRAVVVEHVRPVINPFHQWRTEQEMSQIVGDLEARRDLAGELPRGDDAFQAWLERRYPREDSHVDAWGSTYRLEVARDSFHVVSAGSDVQFGTDRDLRLSGVNPGR